MFAVVYLFEVKKDSEEQFIKAWKDMTHLIFEHEGSMGSRLHRQENGSYIAYAQWPNREAWKNSGNKLPENAYDIRLKMRESCTKFEALFELDCVEDILKKETFNNNI